MKQMIDEILKAEAGLKGDIETSRVQADAVRKEADRLGLEAAESALKEAQAQAEALLKKARDEVKAAEKQKIKEAENLKEFDIAEERMEAAAQKMVDQYVFKEK